jgi:response regulator RpfG family c-di-GMP phosphodiesterase
MDNNNAKASLHMAPTGFSDGMVGMRLPLSEMSGLELLRKARRLHPDTVRIMLTGYIDSRIIADAINDGAVYKFLFKPWDNEQLREILREAFVRHKTPAKMPDQLPPSTR